MATFIGLIMNSKCQQTLNKKTANAFFLECPSYCACSASQAINAWRSDLDALFQVLINC